MAERGGFQGRRKPENEVTLIAREAIEAANDEFNYTIEHLDTRRNLLTECVPLNDLVRKTFRVGPVVLKGLELCEPCGYLEKRTFAGIKAAKHRGGLRCCVIEGRDQSATPSRLIPTSDLRPSDPDPDLRLGLPTPPHVSFHVQPEASSVPPRRSRPRAYRDVP
jgi:hypothetical protein